MRERERENTKISHTFIHSCVYIFFFSVVQSHIPTLLMLIRTNTIIRLARQDRVGGWVWLAVLRGNCVGGKKKGKKEGGWMGGLHRVG